MGWDWDDARIFLAVAREGSTSAAARALGLAQTTCARRIDALEAALGLTLFERGPRGFALGRDGERLLPLAEEMGRAADAIDWLAGQSARGHNSVLRLSVADLLVEPVVHPALAAYRKAWPEVRVDLAVETRYTDIMAGEADIAIRPGPSPQDPRLIVRRLSDNPMGVYCTAAYAERFGQPATLVEHLDRPFACMEGRALAMIISHFPDKRPRFVASTMQPLVEAVASGEFAAILPSLHAERLPDLVRCFQLDADTGSVWLVYHPALRGQRYARDLLRLLAGSFNRWLRHPPSAAGN